MHIPILFEPNYLRDSIWAEQTRLGIEQIVTQRRYTLCKIDGDTYQDFDYEKLFGDGPRLLIMLSTYSAWTQQALSFFEKKKIQVITGNSIQSKAIVGRVSFHYEDAIISLLKHLRSCGCTHTALFGYFRNSDSDIQEKTYFFQEMRSAGITNPEDACFENHENPTDCYHAFKNRIHEFDSVICVNDIAACMLTKALIQDGFRIPEDMQIVTIGATTKLRDIGSVTLTGINYSYRDAGKHMVLLFRYLWHNACDNATSHILGNILISGNLKTGNSTRLSETTVQKASQSAPASDSNLPSLDSCSNSKVRTYFRLETLIQSCDQTDMQILKCLLEGNSYEKISKALFLARSSVHYRIRCLEKAIGVTTLDELKDFLRFNQFEDIIRMN